MIVKELTLDWDKPLSSYPTEPIQLNDIPMLMCANKFDSHIEPVTATLKDICEKVEHPFITDDKENNSLWCFGECIDPEKGHQKSNIVNKSKFFMIDYDNGYTIEEFMDVYKDYFYILYTSFSHTEEHHKFRVIMYGNYESPLNDEEQHYILNECFRNADKTTLQPNRIFYVPAHKQGAPYRYKFNIGKQFPLYNDVIKNLVERSRRDRAQEEARRLTYVKHLKSKTKKSCLKNEKVQTYLNTSYPHDKGNGDSNLNLYKAICVCITCDDNETLELVRQKAKNENWTDKEIDQKIESARRMK